MNDYSKQGLDFSKLRNRIYARVLITSVPSSFLVGYLITLTIGLSGMTLAKVILLVLAPVIGIAELQLFWSVTLLTRRAVKIVPGEPDGARLQRLLELPRKIEIYPCVGTWLIGGTGFAVLASVFFERSMRIIPLDALICLFAALFMGPMLTMMIEGDLRDVMVQEFHKNPKLKLQRTGSIFLVRQRWYLPYVFAVALGSLLVFSGTIIGTKYSQSADQLIDALKANGMNEGAVIIRQELDSLAMSAGIPILILAIGLFIAFGITGWMLARRQSDAASAVERTLRAVAAGVPELPEWVASDETGDLAFAAAAVASELRHVFDQLRSMASGDLSQELQGDSGLITAFRESQSAMLELARMMIALSKGDVSTHANIPGDLGSHFNQLQSAFQAIVDQAQTISKGDLRKDVDIPGALGQAIQRMTGNLRSMVGQTQSVSGNIGDIVVSLQSAASQLSTATTEQVAAVTETANTMTEMAQTSAVSADRASDLIKQGEAASQVVEEGSDASDSAVHAMSAIAESLSKVSSASTALAERVQRIDSIVETVGFLADQSSTLAINAAIEAARAGEAGKGFAVVAREIRGLASDSRKAASQIRDILGEIRERTDQVDGSVAAGTRTVDDGGRHVQRLGEVVSQLGVTVHDAVGLMRQVEGSARQHQAGVGQVSQALSNMQKASESIRDGARLLGDLSSKAHELSTLLQKSSGAYSLPAASA